MLEDYPPRGLITTRPRAAVAVGVTAYVFALSIRDQGHPEKPAWMFGPPHGWLAIAMNIAFYGYLCWLAISFIHSSKGRERLFIAGWFGILLDPVRMLRPEWAVPVGALQFFGITLSLLAALSLLLYPQVDGSGRTATPPKS
jgi:hypothetical protein